MELNKDSFGRKETTETREDWQQQEEWDETNETFEEVFHVERPTNITDRAFACSMSGQ